MKNSLKSSASFMLMDKKLTEFLHSLFTHWSKKVNHIAIRITEQERSVSPGHCCGLLNNFGSYTFDSFIFFVNIFNQKLNDG